MHAQLLKISFRVLKKVPAFVRHVKILKKKCRPKRGTTCFLPQILQIITYKRKNTCFYKIIYFSMQFSAALTIYIVKTYLNSIFTNDLKRKENFSKNVQRYRVCSFKEAITFVVL